MGASEARGATEERQRSDRGATGDATRSDRRRSDRGAAKDTGGKPTNKANAANQKKPIAPEPERRRTSAELAGV